MRWHISSESDIPKKSGFYIVQYGRRINNYNPVVDCMWFFTCPEDIPCVGWHSNEEVIDYLKKYEIKFPVWVDKTIYEDLDLEWFSSYVEYSGNSHPYAWMELPEPFMN